MYQNEIGIRGEKMNYQSILIWIIRIAFLIGSIIEMVGANWANIVFLMAGFILSFVPDLYKKWIGIEVPIGACLVMNLFLFGTQFLGSYLGAYIYFSWWDMMLHLVSGILVGYMGVVLLITLDREQVLFLKKRTSIIVCFIFAVSVTGAVFWEIFEFTSDTLLGTNTQLGSLRDTMEDLICGTIVGGAFALYIGRSLHKGRKCCISQLLQLNRSRAKRKK